MAYDKTNLTSRMHYIDYGLGIFNKSVFKNPMTEYSDLANTYQTLLNTHELAAFEITERFYEIGSLVGINELNTYLANYIF